MEDARKIAMREWRKLPPQMKNSEVKACLQRLCEKRCELKIKRCADVCISLILIAGLSPIMAAAAIAVTAESEGGAIFRQRRVTKYGKRFEILKFRTMYVAEKNGSLLTAADDSRVTKVGRILRKTKTDELPQLFNVLKGEMSLVGVRPEVERFVRCYTPQMMTTLLMPAGITSPASIVFRNEEKLLKGSPNREKEYEERILPEKMKLNTEYIRNFSLLTDAKVLLVTAAAEAKMLKKAICRGKYVEIKLYR